MIVYHGSNSRFDHLLINKKLCKHESTKLNEGYGIYFSTNASVANSYGKYCYTLMINDNYFLDFRKKDVCRNYLLSFRNYIYNQVKVDISKFCNLSSIVEHMYFGGISIWDGVGREIGLLLDSNPSYYSMVCNTKMEKIATILRNYSKKSLYVYMFNYNIKDIGVIKNVDDNIVKIVKREVVGC